MSITSPAFAVGALLGALGVETTLEEELLAVLEQEHELLVKMSLEDLLKIEAQKETVLERMRTLGQQVNSCAKALAVALNIPETETITLSRLTSHVNEPDRTRVRKVQEQLITLTRKVREQNRVNDRLIHGSLSYVTQYLNLLRSLVGGPAAYLSNGAVSGQQESGRILALKG
jgi:flagellar biosynthesis/type III secretory pathway chaperone